MKFLLKNTVPKIFTSRPKQTSRMISVIIIQKHIKKYNFPQKTKKNDSFLTTFSEMFIFLRQKTKMKGKSPLFLVQTTSQ